MRESLAPIVCASCGSLIGVADTYCPKCFAPASTISDLDPMRAIENEGHMLLRATEGKQKPIVLIGIWILFFPVLLVSIFLAVNSFFEGIGSGFSGFVFFWAAVGLVFIAFMVLYKVTRNYFGWNPQIDEEEDEIT